MWQWLNDFRFYSSFCCTNMSLWCLDIRLLKFEGIMIPQHLAWSLCLSQAQVSSNSHQGAVVCILVHILQRVVYSVFSILTKTTFYSVVLVDNHLQTVGKIYNPLPICCQDGQERVWTTLELLIYKLTPLLNHNHTIDESLKTWDTLPHFMALLKEWRHTKSLI